MNNEVFSDQNVFSQGKSEDNNIHKISINLRMPCCPEPTPGERVLLELRRLGAEADFETGNVKGTDMHFETCRVSIIEQVNKGNIAFLSGKLQANCLEGSECKKCVEAFNVVVEGNSTRGYSKMEEIHGDLSSNAYDDVIM